MARLGRLAVDLSIAGKDVGSALLRDALLRAAQIATTEMGIVAVVVDAKNDADVRAEVSAIPSCYQAVRSQPDSA